MSNTENGEFLVLSIKNKDEAVLLRTDLLKEFTRLWVYVYNFNNELFDVRVANNWGAGLEQKVINEIEKFVAGKKITSVISQKSNKKEKLD